MTSPMRERDIRAALTASTVDRLFGSFSSGDASVLKRIIMAVAEITERDGEAAAMAALDRLEVALLAPEDAIN